MAIKCFMKRLAAAALIECIELKSKWPKHQKKGTVTSYCEAANYLVNTSATDDVVADTDANIVKITQLSNKSPKEQAGALWNKVTRCNQVYDEYVFKRAFIEGLSESILTSTDATDSAIAVLPLVRDFNLKCVALPFLFGEQPSNDTIPRHFVSDLRDAYQHPPSQPPLCCETHGFVPSNSYGGHSWTKYGSALTTPRSILTQPQNPPRNRCVAEASATPPAKKGRVSRAIVFMISDRPSDDFVWYVTQNESFMTPCT